MRIRRKVSPVQLQNLIARINLDVTHNIGLTEVAKNEEAWKLEDKLGEACSILDRMKSKDTMNIASKDKMNIATRMVEDTENGATKDGGEKCNCPKCVDTAIVEQSPPHTRKRTLSSDSSDSNDSVFMKNTPGDNGDDNDHDGEGIKANEYSKTGLCFSYSGFGERMTRMRYMRMREELRKGRIGRNFVPEKHLQL